MVEYGTLLRDTMLFFVGHTMMPFRLMMFFSLSDVTPPRRVTSLRFYDMRYRACFSYCCLIKTMLRRAAPPFAAVVFIDAYAPCHCRYFFSTFCRCRQPRYAALTRLIFAALRSPPPRCHSDAMDDAAPDSTPCEQERVTRCLRHTPLILR